MNESEISAPALAESSVPAPVKEKQAEGSETHFRITIVSLLLALVALYGALTLGLLAALLPGLLIYQLVHYGATILERRGIMPSVGRRLLLFFIAAVVIAAIVLCVVGVVSQLRGSDSLAALLQKMADVVGTMRGNLPLSVQEYLPGNFEAWQSMISEWLRGNASSLGVVGHHVGHVIAHLVIGMVIGGLVAIHDQTVSKPSGPLARALSERVGYFNEAFRSVVFSQIRISALNTFLTGIYLAIVLPAIGLPLPFTKTMIALTFVVGLLPIVGNLISNTVIFLVALSVSTGAALGSLAFLIVIHKLEYFVNARIIGARIRAYTWELLIAMLVMEAWFGIPGLVAAPIYYAYIKEELSARGWI